MACGYTIPEMIDMIRKCTPSEIHPFIERIVSQSVEHDEMNSSVKPKLHDRYTNERQNIDIKTHSLVEKLLINQSVDVFEELRIRLTAFGYFKLMQHNMTK